MIKHSIGPYVFCVFLIFSAWNVSAETFALRDKSSQRKLRVVRHYDIVAQQGKPTVAALPALMSFWGETNWQLVKSSRFTYSEQPDKTEITSDDRGQPRRYYQMTWNAPKAGKITVEQTMDVELTCFSTLYTSAKLPYADGVLKRFSNSLGLDEKEGINPYNPDLKSICDLIVKKSRSAEEAVEGVCDWINENIKFVKGKKTSDEALAQRQGSCTPMSCLACSMLRRIGIPAEMVSAKFIGSENGHSFIEVYFPDAGWVFYDLSNWNRGYKSLDCLMTVGWAYRSGTPERMHWTDGHFCTEKDAVPFSDRSETASRLIRKSPQGKKVCGVTVVAQQQPSSAKPRQRPLKELILDTSIPPGQREYSDNVVGLAGATTVPISSGK